MSSLAPAPVRLPHWARHSLRRLRHAVVVLDRIARLPIQFYRPPSRR